MQAIIKIREALWELFPNMWGFNIVWLKSRKDYTEGVFTVNLMSGHIKKLEVRYENKTNNLEIKELNLNTKE